MERQAPGILTTYHHNERDSVKTVALIFFEKMENLVLTEYNARVILSTVKEAPRRKNRGHGHKAQAIELKSTDWAKVYRTVYRKGVNRV